MPKTTKRFVRYESILKTHFILNVQILHVHHLSKKQSKLPANMGFFNTECIIKILAFL